MVTAGNEVELLTLLFFSVTILEITVGGTLSITPVICYLVTSVVIITSLLFWLSHQPLRLIYECSSPVVSLFPFELIMIRSFSSYRIYRCSSWSVSRSWAATSWDVSHSWLLSGNCWAGTSCGVPAGLPAPPLLGLAPLAQLPQLHQTAHDLTQLQPAPVPPEQLRQVPAAKIFYRMPQKYFYRISIFAFWKYLMMNVPQAIGNNL